MNIKNTFGLDIVKVEPNKSDNFEWATPFFSEDYIPTKVEVINNIYLIKQVYLNLNH